MALKHHSCASGGTRFDAASVWQRGSSYVTVRSGGGGGVDKHVFLMQLSVSLVGGELAKILKAWLIRN